MLIRIILKLLGIKNILHRRVKHPARTPAAR